MAIQIASLFASIGVDPSGLNKGLGSAKQSLQQFGGEMAKQVIGTMGLATAIYKAGQFVADSVSDWTDYADAMRLSAQMAGITTEEMSRLVQAADDFRVPMETMQRSMEMALKNGFVPTIENLAALSDRLLAIDDPALRAAEANKIFGKSYADMMPFLLAGGDAIRDTTAGIDANLVVTGRAAQEAKEYKDSLDSLQDAWTGFRNLIGESLAPVLSGIFTGASEEIVLFTKQLLLAKGATEQFTTTGGADLIEYMRLMWVAFGDGTGGVEELDAELRKLYYYVGDVGGAAASTAGNIEELTEEELALVQASIAAAEAQAKMADELANITSLEGYYGGLISLAYDYTDMLGEIDANNEKLAAMTPWQREHSQAAKDLIKANEDIEASMAKMANQITLDMFQATIAVGGVTQAELAAYMQMAIDMGVMSENGAEAAMAAYGNAIKTIDGYKINDKTGNVDIDAISAFAVLDMLQAYALKDKHARAIMHVQYQYGTPAGEDYDQYDIGGYPQGNQASGGLAMADTPYIVGERGPEMFVPNANGQIVSNDIAFGGNSDMLGDILMELQNQPSRIKVAIKEAFALVGG